MATSAKTSTTVKPKTTTPKAKTVTKKIAAPAKTSTVKTVVKKAPAKKATKAKPPKISAHERYKMTEVAAYFIAEQHNFSGSPVDYWTKAEAQISALLK